MSSLTTSDSVPSGATKLLPQSTNRARGVGELLRASRPMAAATRLLTLWIAGMNDSYGWPSALQRGGQRRARVCAPSPRGNRAFTSTRPRVRLSTAFATASTPRATSSGAWPAPRLLVPISSTTSSLGSAAIGPLSSPCDSLHSKCCVWSPEMPSTIGSIHRCASVC